MTTSSLIIFSIISLIGLVIVSYIIEALRSSPKEPEKLSWSNDISTHHIEVNGNNLRYIKTGSGEPLLLLHTLRTQLDMFQNVIPCLSEYFTVYAFDYPGHGYSDIPEVEYTPEFLLSIVEGFIEKNNFDNVTVVGESIGGTLGLLLAAKANPKVKNVISINPYDYGNGYGITRGSWVGRILFYMNNIPVFGATNWRLRFYPAFLHIMQGGVANKNVLPTDLMHEIDRVGNRPNQYRAFMSLIRNFPLWEKAKHEYSKIKTPVLLIYGENDWSTIEERLETKSKIPLAEFKTVPDSGHFLSLEEPSWLIELIIKFASKNSEI
ncbi:MAG: alpha/beta hydrolase [Proteobacteria bacterium]|nr:alpha/beta hydrolase [Pseudomonadota bacterium]